MVDASRAMVMLAIEDGEEVDIPPIHDAHAHVADVAIEEVSDDDDGFAPVASAPSRPKAKAMPKAIPSAGSASSSPGTTSTHSRRVVPKRITGKKSPPGDPIILKDKDEQ